MTNPNALVKTKTYKLENRLNTHGIEINLFRLQMSSIMFVKKF